ncbi:hypothetical protein ACI2KR_27215 [Pseudomonas luteola]
MNKSLPALKKELRSRMSSFNLDSIKSRCKGASFQSHKLMYSVEGVPCISDYEDWGYTREGAGALVACIKNMTIVLDALDSQERTIDDLKGLLATVMDLLPDEHPDRIKIALALAKT